MDLERAANHLKTLSDEKRFTIIQILGDAGEEWLSIREVARRADLAATTVRNQINYLEKTGLAVTKKRSRKLYCLANSQELIDFLDFLNNRLRPSPVAKKHVEPYRFDLDLETDENKKPAKKTSYKSLRDRLDEVVARATGTD